MEARPRGLTQQEASQNPRLSKESGVIMQGGPPKRPYTTGGLLHFCYSRQGTEDARQKLLNRKNTYS